MRRLTPAWFLIVLIVACASTNIQGRIENQQYIAPNGKITLVAPDPGGFYDKVNDIYVASIDRGLFEEQNEFGLRGLYYTGMAKLGITPPSSPEERRLILAKGLTNFALPNVFQTVSPNAQVAYRKFVQEDGEEMLLAVICLPGRSGAFDVNTGKHFDAYPAILVLLKGGYIVVLRVQANIVEAQGPAPEEMASHYLGGLRKLKSGLEIRD